MTKTKYKYTIKTVYKTKNNKHVAMVGGQKRYVDMTKHPSFKGGLNNDGKRGLNYPQGSTSLNGSPGKQPKPTKTSIRDLPNDVISSIEGLVYNTQTELEQFKTLNATTTKASKNNMDELLNLYKTITGVGMATKNAASKSLSLVRNKNETPQEIEKEFS